jgi:hypothetical protein
MTADVTSRTMMASVRAMVSATQRALGAITLRRKTITAPALAIGSTNVSVVWDTPMPTADYAVTYGIETDGSILGRVSGAVLAGSKTVNGFTLVITATGLVVISLGLVKVECIGIVQS